MVPMLQEDGHDVVGFDSNLFRGAMFSPANQDIPKLHLDIRDARARHFDGFDAVIHLAALSNDGLANYDPDVTCEINQTASIRMAELAKKAGVRRFIFSSSCSIYGKAGDDLVAETASIDVITPYTKSKANVEHEVSKLANDEFSPTYMRNATAYGLSPCHSFELVLNNLVAWAHAKGLVYIKSDGSPWRPTVHIEDISRAFLAALNVPRETVHNEAFNVGRTEENYSIRELAEVVRDVVVGSSVEFAPDGQPDARSYKVDFSKIQRVLPDYKPEWDVRRGAEQMYAAYRRAGIIIDEIEGPRFKRIEHLKQLMASGQLDSSLRWTAAVPANNEVV
jgi:nucleoside-diphosphate-sugar epimerase